MSTQFQDFPHTIFITGTDTGVGKTLVTALLAIYLQERGLQVGVMKPFATGCVRNAAGDLESDDAVFLRDATGIEDELSFINPVRWEEPLAPLAASRREKRPLRRAVEEFWPSYEELVRRRDCVLVEGVGGLMVPIEQRETGAIITCADFANELGAPVVVVARRTLGTINHSVLTCRTPLESPAHFTGLVWCDAQPVAEDDVAAQTSPAIVERMTGLPRWGSVPFLEDFSRENLHAAAKEYLQF